MAFSAHPKHQHRTWFDNTEYHQNLFWQHFVMLHIARLLALVLSQWQTLQRHQPLLKYLQLLSQHPSLPVLLVWHLPQHFQHQNADSLNDTTLGSPHSHHQLLPLNLIKCHFVQPLKQCLFCLVLKSIFQDFAHQTSKYFALSIFHSLCYIDSLAEPALQLWFLNEFSLPHPQLDQQNSPTKLEYCLDQLNDSK